MGLGLDKQHILQPHNPYFAGNNLHSHLLAALSGCCVAFLHDLACEPYLAKGELIELFPELPRTRWGVYIYRPQCQITHPRIKLVFDLLVELLAQH
ncbi:LysR substrate-binding domain-containing protein [Mesocricetibacter intestinalis]|uniref:LysR substrate-binding domain-containing protein n=1 Tax=Mesocricetibacter intestinalis TaxID=1521930 RepID=UPI00105F722E